MTLLGAVYGHRDTAYCLGLGCVETWRDMWLRRTVAGDEPMKLDARTRASRIAVELRMHVIASRDVSSLIALVFFKP